MCVSVYVCVCVRACRRPQTTILYHPLAPPFLKFSSPTAPSQLKSLRLPDRQLALAKAAAEEVGHGALAPCVARKHCEGVRSAQKHQTTDGVLRQHLEVDLGLPQLQLRVYLYVCVCVCAHACIPVFVYACVNVREAHNAFCVTVVLFTACLGIATF